MSIPLAPYAPILALLVVAAAFAVVDATRVLMAGGPTGGSLSLVRELDPDGVLHNAFAARVLG